MEEYKPSLILPPGISPGPDTVSHGERVEHHKAKVSQVTCLSDLTADYSFFTHGLLYCCVDLAGHDPIAAFCHEQKVNDKPLSFDLEHQVFSGFEQWDEHWNRLLFAWPHDIFQKFKSWLASASYIDRRRRKFTRVRDSLHMADDVVWLYQQATAPILMKQIPVTCFCLDTNRYVAYFSPADGVLLLKVSMPMKETVALAESLLGDATDPFDDLATFRNGSSRGGFHE